MRQADHQPIGSSRVDLDAVSELVALMKECGVREIDISSSRRAQYSSDASNYRVVPVAIVFPHSVDEVIATQQVAATTGVALTIRGAGTSVAGNAVGPGIVLDMSRYLNRVIDVDPFGMTATVEPGVVLDALQNRLADAGLRFGPDPSTHSRCTIGGMIGNNACGAHSVAYGRTAENVVSLDVIDGTGRRFLASKGLDQIPGLSDLVRRYEQTISSEFGRFGRQVSGYSLEHLTQAGGEDLAKTLVGTEGTCTVVVGAKLGLVRTPRAKALVVLGYQDMATAADAVSAIMDLSPQAIEGIDSRLVEVVKRHRSNTSTPELPAGHGWLFVETAGASEAEAIHIGKAIVARADAMGSLLIPDGAHSRALWRIREDGAGLAGRTPEGAPAWPGWEDAAVPPDVLGSYLRDFQELLSQHRLDGLIYGHFGDGCIHVRLDFALANHAELLRPFLVDAARLVASYGGSLSGEHGDGRARSELLPLMYSATAIRAFEEFKGLLDPKNSLNPGVIVQPRPLDRDLRVPDQQVIIRRGGFALTQDHGDFGAAVLRCVGVGKCRADNTNGGGFMCPSYLATSDEKDSTRGRARVLQEMLNGTVIKDGWRSHEVHEVLDLCLSCKACASDCPAGVDMARYKSEVLYQTYRHRIRPLSHYTLGWLPRWAHLASLLPTPVNKALSNTTLHRLTCRMTGIDPRRSLPRFARRTFTSLHQSSPLTPIAGSSTKSRTVVLMLDSFTDNFSPEVGEAALEVLNAAGYAVEIAPAGLCCAITWISTGQLDTARRKLGRLVEALAPSAAAGLPIVVLEPSCAAVLRDELMEIVDDDRARSVSEATVTLAEVLNLARIRESSPWNPPSLAGRDVIVQPHCHQYAVIGFEADRVLLESAGARVHTLSGCCGLAGNFGMERGHYELSLKVAQRSLLPALAQADRATTVLADGFSCRTQVADLTDRQAIHLAQLFVNPSFDPYPTTPSSEG
ncbi:FAD-binding and (Fe-S)-binding domain-containing protein [Ferrimicrobium sp.]|uniref:FAD-binding and (Fe-S)-binding domain-containing protein n=1 Tax=Ferrimicrobium sp. TaxID=2926050 RepID=UPI002636699B|nr:FAD-binding and (Fe-S)-binding domain-containing protein [Ferrimicrobium sp.]